MIKSVRHKGLDVFFQAGKTAGIQSKHAKRLRLQLAILDTAQTIDDIDRPGFKLHKLKGKMKNRWAISGYGNDSCKKVPRCP